ncbi:MAG: hypothetical protein GXO45_03865 [Aquificae bacterium]|nr:hypothetical protein [Aquificota bacterium]
MIYRILLAVLLMFFSSCGYKTVQHNKENQQVYCITKIKLPTAQETALDVLSRSISEAVLSSGNRLQCSGETTRFIEVVVSSLSVRPIGYSVSQRASVYKVSIDMLFTVKNRKNEVLLQKRIKEMTQYTGTGLNADIEKRYAIEEIGRIIGIRVYSLLNSNG